MRTELFGVHHERLMTHHELLVTHHELFGMRLELFMMHAELFVMRRERFRWQRLEPQMNTDKMPKNRTTEIQSDREKRRRPSDVM